MQRAKRKIIFLYFMMSIMFSVTIELSYGKFSQFFKMWNVTIKQFSIVNSLNSYDLFIFLLLIENYFFKFGGEGSVFIMIL